MDGRKLSLSSLCAAAILFFFPWLVVSCQGLTILSQTGVQTVYGGGSAGESLQSMQKELGGGDARIDEKETTGKMDGVGTAFLVVLSVIALLTAIALYASAIGRDDQNVQPAEVASLVAAGLLLLQAVIGFPLETEMEAEMAKQEMPSDPDNPLGASPEMAKALGSTMVGVKYRPALYFTILAMLGGGAGLIYRALQKKTGAAAATPADEAPPQAVPPPDGPPAPTENPD